MRLIRMRIGHTERIFQNVDHIAKCGVNRSHANNKRIERLKGTLKERIKVQKGWKSKKKPDCRRAKNSL
jgi:hypothetical protein